MPQMVLRLGWIQVNGRWRQVRVLEDDGAELRVEYVEPGLQADADSPKQVEAVKVLRERPHGTL